VRTSRGDIEPPNGANAALGERRQRDFSASGSFSIISAGLAHLGLTRDLISSGAKTRGAIPVVIAFPGDKFIDGKLVALTDFIERHLACAHQAPRRMDRLRA